MKGRNLFATAFIVLAVGIALTIMHKGISSLGVVITGGILFILAGLLNLMFYVGDKRRGRVPSTFATALGWLSSAASILLGISMLLFQSAFAQLVSIMFAILVLVGAIYQFMVLIYKARPVRLPGWLYILPTAMTGAAIFIYFQDGTIDDDIIMLTTGIALIVFGVASIIEASIIGNANRRGAKNATATSGDTAAQPEPTAQIKPVFDYDDTPAMSDNDAK